MKRHHIDADPDPKFHVVAADPDPNPDWLKTMPILCHNFQYFGHHIEIFLKKVKFFNF